LKRTAIFLLINSRTRFNRYCDSSNTKDSRYLIVVIVGGGIGWAGVLSKRFPWEDNSDITLPSAEFVDGNSE